MSIWKKIAGLFFEESDAVLVDDELEDITFAEEVVISKKPIVKPREERKEQEEQTITEFKTKKEEVVETKKEVSSTKFINIDILDEKAKEEKESTSRVVHRSTQITTIKDDRKEFEFSPVISPIFGSKEDEVSSHKGVSNTQTRPPKKHVNPLGTVISPYFGLGELEEFKVEAQESIEKKEKSLQVDLPFEEIERFEEDDDVNSISLDDIIVEQEVDEEDDMMQISLFGEATSLRESEEKKDKIKDK